MQNIKPEQLSHDAEIEDLYNRYDKEKKTPPHSFFKGPNRMARLEGGLQKLGNLNSSFDYVKISIASPAKILSWGLRTPPPLEEKDGTFTPRKPVGEVKTPESINFRTNEPVPDGLFCEKTFGPTKSWQCDCGKYRGFAENKICEKCGVELNDARVRRYRMGYIKLSSPIVHTWYFKAVPNYLMLLLKSIDNFEKQNTKFKKNRHLTFEHLDEIIYSRQGLGPLDPSNPLQPFSGGWKNIGFLTAQQWKPYLKSGGELIQNALILLKKGKIIIDPETHNIILEVASISEKIIELREDLIKKMRKKTKISENLKSSLKRLRLLESFVHTETEPAWICLTMLPILPPTLRPLMELENGTLVSADVNELYRLIMNRNTRLGQYLLLAPELELHILQDMRLLQQSVECLIDNSRLPNSRTEKRHDIPLVGLTEKLEGKFGRFRYNLLGKRVDYSARSVIIVGPTLRLNQFGLPYQIGVELFETFLINQLLLTKIKPPVNNIKLARTIIRKNKPFVWTLLEKLTKRYSLLLNRAPTLHRFGIQAFDPVLILGQAIHLHPLVCTGFNADFDGDQMAVHLPLYEASQMEAKRMMRPSFNVLSPAAGEVILKPTQDMVIGAYYLTLLLPNINQSLSNSFGNENDAIYAFHQKKIGLHLPILVRYGLQNFHIEAKNNNLVISEQFFTSTSQKTLKSLNEKKITIYKQIPFGKRIKRYYFLTNVGILIGRNIGKTNYQITDLFLETTPGRLIFSQNFKYVMNSINLEDRYEDGYSFEEKTEKK